MWPFRRKSSVDEVIAVMDDATEFACEKWLYFNSVLAFKPEVPFLDVLAGFLMPLIEGLKNNFPALRNSPEPLFLMIAARAIVRSGTHTREEMEELLGFQILE